MEKNSNNSNSDAINIPLIGERSDSFTRRSTYIPSPETDYAKDENTLKEIGFDEAMIKNKAHEKSYVTYILADHSKFNRVFSVSFGEMSNSCIITDKLTDNSYKDLAVIKEVDG